MTARSKFLLGLAVVAVALVPILLLAKSARSSALEEFLATRTVLFSRLESNIENLPEGYKLTNPHVLSRRQPLDDHIRSAVGRGKLWYADNLSSYIIELPEAESERSASGVVMEFFDDLSDGLEEIGLTSSQSGGPSLSQGSRAAQIRTWRDAAHHFNVSLTAVIDVEKQTAFVSQVVHERY